MQSDRVRRQAHGLKQVWRHSELLQQLLSQTSTISRHCVLPHPTHDMSDGRIRLQCNMVQATCTHTATVSFTNVLSHL